MKLSSFSYSIIGGYILASLVLCIHIHRLLNIKDPLIIILSNVLFKLIKTMKIGKFIKHWYSIRHEFTQDYIVDKTCGAKNA